MSIHTEKKCFQCLWFFVFEIELNPDQCGNSMDDFTEYKQCIQHYKYSMSNTKTEKAFDLMFSLNFHSCSCFWTLSTQGCIQGNLEFYECVFIFSIYVGILYDVEVYVYIYIYKGFIQKFWPTCIRFNEKYIESPISRHQREKKKHQLYIHVFIY